MQRTQTDTPSWRRRHGPARVRRASIVAALLASVALLAGCLGPTEFDPTGTAPIGSLDAVVASGSSIRVIGWALDPDTLAPIDVTVSSRQVATTHRADRNRPDVAAVHRFHGPAHGFDARTQSLPPGLNQVCVWVENVGRGSQARALGCADVLTGNDNPVGAYDALQQVGPNRIRAVGWAYDPDAGSSSEVTVSVEGGPSRRVVAATPRPDVSSRFRTSRPHGFVVDLTVPVGNRRVCVRIENRGRGAATSLGCKVLSVDSVPATGPGGGIASLAAVGPPAGHPLATMDRDGGVSTTLRDGSVLWFFGDSSEPLDGGGFRYFVNNTAAWARPGSPNVTRDAVAPGSVPFRFVAPAEEFSGGCPTGFEAVMWPLSATNVAVAGSPTRDRVIAFFGNVCLDGQDARSRGVAVVEWTYDAADPPDGREIQGTVLRQNMFPVGAEYGTASMVHEGWLYAYECGRPADERPPGTIWPSDPAYSGCTVARVLPTDAADPQAWTYWTGGDTWSPIAEDAVVMDLPGGSQSDPELPIVSLGVVDDPVFGITMVYSPWPGFTDRVMYRRAASPTGPWTAAATVQLPGCFEWANGTERLCYAGTPQPWRSTAGQLGVGWYDQFRATDPVRGAYVAGSAPVQG